MSDFLNSTDLKSMKRAMFIINPVSGKKLALRHVPKIIRTLMDAGYVVTTLVTGKRGDATAYAANYGDEFDLIVCTGGDGTLNETLAGLASNDIDVPLGYIPAGSTNDFALCHGLSTDVLTAAQDAAFGTVERYDIGKFGDSQYFSYVAAFGAFSWLSYTTPQEAKNVLGHSAYLFDAVKDLPKLRAEHVRLTDSAGIVHEGDYLFGAVCNSTSIAGTIELPSDVVDTCDGLFEVFLVKEPHNIIELESIVHGILVQDYSSPYIEFFQTRSVIIDNPPELYWSLDGEKSEYREHIKIELLDGFLQLKS